MNSSSSRGIAIVGCGTVGGATAALLLRDRDRIAKKSGVTLSLKHIVDRDFRRAESLKLDSTLYQSDYAKVLADPEVDIIVELVGGTTVAREIIERALKAGKHVVTANKALLAHFGPDLMRIAHEVGVSLAFEASCAGGIPVIRMLYDGLLANRIDAIYGIVNGTCNYILTEMIEKGQSYAEALAAAQRGGLAEADPRLDVSGLDSAHKLTIMASLGFGQRVELERVAVEGIDTLEVQDVKFGQELGYIVKLLAIAQRFDGGLSLRVRPSFISRAHPLAWVSGPFNAVSIYGHAVGHTMYYGRGAGGSPTASAIVSDLLSIALGTTPLLFGGLQIWPDRAPEATQLPSSEISSRYYLRVMVTDRPGVFAQLATILGNHGISISSVLQKESDAAEDEGIPVVITTHTAVEGNLLSALREIDALDVVRRKSICIGIIDEQEEAIAL